MASRMTKGHKQGVAAQKNMPARTANHSCVWSKSKVESSLWASEMDVGCVMASDPCKTAGAGQLLTTGGVPNSLCSLLQRQ
jgi:acyl-CoA reductase-like NAD-dependent aldehyde dehydrogenase